MLGWIKLHRQIQDHWVFDNADYYRAWSIILFKANHSEKKLLIDGAIIICKRGEAYYSLGSWVKFFGRGWTVKKVRTFFSLLNKDGMLVTKGARQTTRLTVCNYLTYQDEGRTKGPTEGKPRADQGQQLNNEENVNNEKKNNIVEIVSFLNSTLSTSFKESTAKTQSFINARIAEGFTVDDFKTVIIKKHLQWKNDSKMVSFLRPETLFGTKFESYLNEKKTLNSDSKLQIERFEYLTSQFYKKDQIMNMMSHEFKELLQEIKDKINEL